MYSVWLSESLQSRRVHVHVLSVYGCLSHYSPGEFICMYSVWLSESLQSRRVHVHVLSVYGCLSHYSPGKFVYIYSLCMVVSIMTRLFMAATVTFPTGCNVHTVLDAKFSQV